MIFAKIMYVVKDPYVASALIIVLRQWFVSEGRIKILYGRQFGLVEF